MIPAQPGDVVATYADSERAQRKLGFTPKTRLAEGLRQFVNWYMENLTLALSVRNYRLSSRE